MTKKALEAETGDLEILVGEEVAKENVSRFVIKSGAEVEVSEIEDGYKLIVTR